MLIKLLTIGLPSLCVIVGHAYAGGLIFSLMHDRRIMKNKSGKLCLSEIHAGAFAWTPGYI